MAKDIPKLSDKKPPRKKPVAYQPRRNPAAEKVLGSQEARERAEADRALIGFSGEGKSREQQRMEEPISTFLGKRKPKRSISADWKPSSKPKPATPDTRSEWEKAVASASQAKVELTPKSSQSDGLTASQKAAGARRVAEDLLARAHDIHRRTVLHGTEIVDSNDPSPSTLIDGRRYHGVSRDASGLSVDPRTAGSIRADGTRVGEKAKTISEIISGLAPIPVVHTPEVLPEKTAEAIIDRRKQEMIGAQADPNVVKPATARFD